jgi:hypothetical protein
MTVFCRYHCRRCGSHFTSLEAFDAHHEGSGETLRPWTFPDDAGLVELFGTCKLNDPSKPARGVVVYRLVREGKYGAAGGQTARGGRSGLRMEALAAWQSPG